MLDQRHLLKLLSKAADGIATDADRREIAQSLLADAQLRDEYVRFAHLEAALGHACDGDGGGTFEPSFEASGSVESRIRVDVAERPEASAARSRRATDWMQSHVTRRRAWTSLALAASLAAVAVTVGLRWSSCASLISVQAASWGSSQHHAAGDALTRQWIDLESGVAVVGFDSSALLQITGPARFRPTGPDSCRVEYGDVVALVPTAAQGFVVDTPGLRVTDLGTSFRINATRDGHTTLQVLEGLVEAKSKQSGQSHRLMAGAAVSADLDSEMVVAAPERTAPSTSNRVAFRAKHLSSLGRDGLKRNDRCFLFLERYDCALPFDLDVNIAEVGSHGRFDQTEATLPRGERIDCYLVHGAPFNGTNVVDGSVTFQGEILGVLTSSDKLNATNDLFGSPWSLTCRDHQRGLEEAPDKNADAIEISPDRRTLRVRLRTEAIDQMRVLVRSASK